MSFHGAGDRRSAKSMITRLAESMPRSNLERWWLWTSGSPLPGAPE
jgi:hypothetical protein